MASPPSKSKLRGNYLSSALGRGALSKTENWESELRRMRQRAPRDRIAAVKLLTMFASLARDRDRAPAHPVLVRYVAQCVSEWAKTGFDSNAVARCFHVQRPKSRPPSTKARQKRIGALVAYFRAVAAGKGEDEAIADACKGANFAAYTVRKLVEEPEVTERMIAYANLSKSERESLLLATPRK